MEVRFVHDAAGLAPLRGELEALNQASPRRCLFTSPGVLSAFLATEPAFAPPASAEPWIALASEGGRLLGYLALRRVVERIAGLPAPRLEPLITLETDRPHPVARPEDQGRVAAALWGALLALPRRTWTLLELPMQDGAAELAPPALPAGTFVRYLPCRPASVVPLPERFEAWWGALAKGQRHNVRRELRLLEALGPISALATPEGMGDGPLDVYLDLERRSWKAGDAGSASLHRHPSRVAYYRRLLQAAGPARLRIEFLLVHDQPVAAKIVGSYAGQLYHLHTTFDDGCAAASPGSLMAILSMRWAVQRGFRRVNLMPDFPYAKRRWGAEVTETRRLQVFRTASAHGLKALAGDLRRRLRVGAPAAGPEVDHNPSKAAVRRHHLPPAAPPAPGRPLDPRLAAAAAAQGAERLDPAALRQALACLGRGR